MIGRCSGVLGTVCASYPTSKEQRESENIPQLSWKGTGCPEWRHKHRQHSQLCGQGTRERGQSPLPAAERMDAALNTLQHISTVLHNQALCLQGNSRQGMNAALVFFAPSSSSSPTLLFLLVALLLCENECNLSWAGYTSIFKCYLWSFMGNIILAELDTLMRTKDMCFT